MASRTPYTPGQRSSSGDRLRSCASDSDYFEVRIDFLFQHSLDRHQSAGQRAWATAAGALVANAQRVIVESKHFKITSVAHQRRSYSLIQYLDRKSVV